MREIDEYKKGKPIFNQGSICIVNNEECFGIHLDDDSYLMIEEGKELFFDCYELEIWHQDQSYKKIGTYELNVENFVSLIPKRSYTIDEVATFAYYLTFFNYDNYQEFVPAKIIEYIKNL